MKKLLLILLAILASSCSLQNKIKKAKIIAYQNPKEFSDFCATVYPVKESFIKGKDSIINSIITIKGDSVPCPKVNGIIPFVKCPDQKIVNKYIYRIDTVIKENTALSSNLKNQLTELNNKNISLVTEKEINIKQSNKKTKWIIGLSVLLFGSLIVHIKKLI